MVSVFPQNPRSSSGIKSGVKNIFSSGHEPAARRIESNSRSCGGGPTSALPQPRSLFRNRISGAERNRHGSSRATEHNPLGLSRSPVDRPREFNSRVPLGGLSCDFGRVAVPRIGSSRAVNARPTRPSGSDPRVRRANPAPTSAHAALVRSPCGGQQREAIRNRVG